MSVVAGPLRLPQHGRDVLDGREAVRVADRVAVRHELDGLAPAAHVELPAGEVAGDAAAVARRRERLAHRLVDGLLDARDLVPLRFLEGRRVPRELEEADGVVADEGERRLRVGLLRRRRRRPRLLRLAAPAQLEVVVLGRRRRGLLLLRLRSSPATQ